jgi:hypothetical protein
MRKHNNGSKQEMKEDDVTEQSVLRNVIKQNHTIWKNDGRKKSAGRVLLL